jgi:hypothetical protein
MKQQRLRIGTDCGCAREAVSTEDNLPRLGAKKNESAPDSVSRRTLVRTALPRSLLTTSLTLDANDGNGTTRLLRRQLAGVAAIDSPRAQHFRIFMEMLFRGGRSHVNGQPKDLTAVG